MRRLPWLIFLICLQAGPPGSAQDMDIADLIGTWDDITPERERHGYQVKRPATSLTFEGTACTWEVRGGVKFRQSLFVPVQAGEHRGLDFVTVTGGAFWTTRAVFRVEGDTLTIKEGALDRHRPTDLVAEEFGAGLVHEISGAKNAREWAPVHTYRRRAK